MKAKAKSCFAEPKGTKDTRPFEVLRVFFALNADIPFLIFSAGGKPPVKAANN